jgi:hypothetical protein
MHTYISGCVMKNEAKFWSAVLRLFPLPEYHCSLVDDNRLNLQLVDSLSIQPLRILEPFHTLVILSFMLSYLRKRSFNNNN